MPSGRAAEDHYLDLVTAGGYLKFGRGTASRVRAHVSGGASVIGVRRSSFSEVVAAEAGDGA